MKIAAKLLVVFFCLSISVLAGQSPAATSPEKQNTTQEKWEHYATGEDGVNYFYNAGNIETLKGNIVKVWVQALYPPTSDKYSDVRFQWEVNCTSKKIRGIQAYAKQKDGKTKSITESSDWSAIPAESTAASLYEKVCKKKEKAAQ